MIKHWTRTLVLFACLLVAGIAHAQVLTNKDLLQSASRTMAGKNRDLHTKLLSLAKQKNWPLVLHTLKGRRAYLMGVDPAGLPIYTTTTDNIISAATIRTNQLWPGGATGLNLSGSSTNIKGKIAVWDEGKVRSTHVELTGRINQVDGASSISDHSTHVAGTMVAAGVNPLAKGMSFGAQQLQAYDFNNDVSEMMSAAAGGLLVSSHSYASIAGWFQNADQGNRWEFWGAPGDTVDYKFGDYDAEAQVWDSIAYNAPDYLISKAGGNNRDQNGPAVGSPYYRFNASGVMASAGNRPAGISSNNGYNIIATYGVAKNILTLGAVFPIPGGYNSPSDAVLASFSSWGPTADGRIKPDVVADGINVLSSVGTSDNAYDIFSGTSMATPAAAGSSFLLQELYSKIHAGAFMRAATLKGIIIHTADETGPSPGPDYQYGWGLIDMQKAASVITSDTAAVRDQEIHESSLSNGTKDAETFNIIASGKTPITATISWTDPPATPNTTTKVDTTRKLVNDLDIRITDGTSTFMPWVLNPANPSAAATTGDNIRDNVEKIEIDSLIPGKSYTVHVTHKGSLARNSQAYSLLLSGVGGQAYCASSGSGAGGARIDNLTLANINNNNSAGCKSYSDFTGVAAARLPVGQTLPISITTSSCDVSNANRVITVYIDLNNNGNFTDPGEMLLQSGVLTNGTFNGSITIPGNTKAGGYSRMRVIAEETSSPASVSPCGTYGNGETQDYRVLFTTPSIDVGVTQLEYPTLTTCASDSQIVTLHIRNFGSVSEDSVPVTTVVKNGATTVATLSAVCKDTIAPGSEVLFTYNTTFATVAGTTYTFTSTTGLPADLNTADNQNVTTLTVSPAEAAPSGTATICGTSTQAILKTSVTGNDVALWYDSPTATTPIATGNNATTSDIPANKTYYLAVNDLPAHASPPNKLFFDNGAGAYFSFGGNYISFTTSVPLTIESARMYIGNSGKMTFTLATLAGSSYAHGYSYFPLYTTTIDVYATTPNPQPGTVNVAAGDNTDKGAIFYLNIPVPTPGNYIIIIDNSDNSTAFLNVGAAALPYPVSLPGVISFTGTYISDGKPADTLTFPKQVFYPFYDLSVRLEGCASPRVPVVASTPAAPVITLNGDVFTSSIANGNQWYRSGTAIPGAINQTDTAIFSGLYNTVVTDASGCQLTSNSINFTSTGTNNLPGSTIDLTISPNPNAGTFNLSFNFTTADNLSITLVNTLGQTVYESVYPDFAGPFSKVIDGGALASGMYVLKIQHGNDVFIKKILVRR
ncbi:MAG: S8 family serine peptidase [Bacteroidota bacterium]|nr:S8 family serine peptidase [Bacteroidota bacterium]